MPWELPVLLRLGASRDIFARGGIVYSLERKSLRHTECILWILRETLLAQMGAGAEFDVRTTRIATAIDRVLNYTAEVAKQLDADGGGGSDAASSTSGGPSSGTSPR